MHYIGLIFKNLEFRHFERFFRFDQSDRKTYKKAISDGDSYLGGECFVGEEVVWLHDIPVWSMNYVGRVIGENFSDEF